MNIQQLMKQAQSMQSNMEKIERELADKETSVTRQGISLTMNGNHELTSVTLEPQLLTQENKEILEDLLLITLNQLTKTIQDERNEKLGSLTQGLNLPGMK